MAEINVERKQPSIWPWVIGLIALALVVWFLVESLGGDGGADAAAPMDADTPAATAPSAPGPDLTPPAAAGAAGQDAAGVIPDTALP